MFVNCPSCRGLVATDPATDEPPERCPRCAARLRGQAAPPPSADDARSGVAAAIAEFVDRADAAAADPADAPAAQPAISIATLLQAEPPQAESPTAAAKIPEEPATGRATEAADQPGADVAIEATADHAVEATADPDPDPDPDPDRAHEPATRPRPERAAGRTAPSFARRRAGDGIAPGARRWPMAAAIVALSLLLGLQWLVADRARLAADPGWRPVVERTCALLRCSLPPWREAAAFTLLERDVRPHPSAPGALRITASFRNDAAWAQAWPELVLTLSDIDGRPLGMRAFTPEEYFNGWPPSPLIESGQGVVIRMDVVEPGPGAVGFAFDFR